MYVLSRTTPKLIGAGYADVISDTARCLSKREPWPWPCVCVVWTPRLGRTLLAQDGRRPSASIVVSDEPGYMQLARSGQGLVRIVMTKERN